MKRHSFAFMCACMLAALFALFGVLAAYFGMSERLIDPRTLPLAVLLIALLCFGTWKSGPLLERLPAWLLASIVVTCAVCMRMWWLYLVKAEPVSDFYRFYMTALELTRGKIFMLHYVAIFPHTLGYPAILSLAFRLFGASVMAAQGLNVLMSAAAAYLLFSIGNRLGGKAAGFYSALLWAFFPSQILFCSFVCTEPLFLALMLGCIRLYLSIILVPERKRAAQLILWGTLGALIGLCSAVRPMWPIMTAAFALDYLVFSPEAMRKAGKRRVVRQAAACAVMLVCCLLINSGVYAAVEKSVGQPVARTGAGWNLYVGMNMRAGGQYSHEDERQFSQAVRRGLTAPELQEYFSDAGKKRLLELVRDGRLGELLRVKFSRVWSTDDNALYWMRQSQAKRLPSRLSVDLYKKEIALIINIGYYCVLLAGMAGFAACVRKRKYTPMLFCILLCGFVFLFLLLEANGRYHFPADALLCLMAPCALCARQKPANIDNPRVR